jgi:malonate transporter and related proteins
MLAIFNITAPIYLIIGLGLLSVKSGLIAQSELGVLGRILLLFVLPATVFRAITSYPLAEVLNLAYLGAYAAGSVLALLVGVIGARKWAKKSMVVSGLYGMGFATSNSMFVGFPIISQVVGEQQADIALALCLIVENIIIVPLALMVCDAEQRLPWPQALARVFKGLRTNYIFLAIVLGFAVAIVDLPIPSIAARSLDLLSGSAAPMALFMIGGVLSGQQVLTVRTDLLAVTAGKLLIHPAMVILMMLLVPQSDAALLTAGVLFAAMPLPAIFPVLAKRYNQEGLAATALVVGVSASFFSVSVWLYAMPFVQRLFA